MHRRFAHKTMSHSFEETENLPLYQRYPGLQDPGIYNPFEAPDGENGSLPRLREQRIATAAERLRAFLGHVDVASCTFDETCEEAELALNHLRLSWGQLRS